MQPLIQSRESFRSIINCTTRCIKPKPAVPESFFAHFFPIAINIQIIEMCLHTSAQHRYGQKAHRSDMMIMYALGRGKYDIKL